MKNWLKFMALLLVVSSFMGCEKDYRNIAIGPDPNIVPEVIPYDINIDGFDLLEKMQGHWVGINSVVGIDYPWFSFDYRAISPSHTFGIFEGGSMGNLFTSFFVTDYKGTHTIMARNGGVLSGIYRTSYFVLDSVGVDITGKYYRLVDAKGGTDLMYMELKFNADSLYFNAYTSGLGSRGLPTRHMTFKGSKQHLELAETAAAAVDFPQDVVAWDFSNGFNESYLYQEPTDVRPRSATFLALATTNDVYSLAQQSGDPFKITDQPRLATLEVNAIRNNTIDGANLIMYLSDKPLTDASGQFDWQNLDYILHFPNIEAPANDFLFTYMHPGDYYVTVVADMNNDGFLSLGDITHISQQTTLTPEGQHQITIDNITIQN
jgi:hypothetical protein